VWVNKKVIKKIKKVKITKVQADNKKRKKYDFNIAILKSDLL